MKTKNTSTSAIFLATALVLLFVFAYYLFFVFVAWIVVSLLSLTYSPWVVGLVLLIIKMVFFK